jgi:hypothetical protein
VLVGRCLARGHTQGRTGIDMAGRYEYKVVEVREKMMGSKMSGDKLAKILNENASSGGWQLKAITAADVKGRVGPGGVEGLLITFEAAGRLKSTRGAPPPPKGGGASPVRADVWSAPRDRLRCREPGRARQSCPHRRCNASAEWDCWTRHCEGAGGGSSPMALRRPAVALSQDARRDANHRGEPHRPGPVLVIDFGVREERWSMYQIQAVVVGRSGVAARVGQQGTDRRTSRVPMLLSPVSSSVAG